MNAPPEGLPDLLKTTEDALDAAVSVLRAITNTARNDYPRVRYIVSPEPLALAGTLLAQINNAKQKGLLR